MAYGEKDGGSIYGGAKTKMSGKRKKVKAGLKDAYMAANKKREQAKSMRKASFRSRG